MTISSNQHNAIADLFDPEDGFIIVRFCRNNIQEERLYRSTNRNFHDIQSRLSELSDVANFSDTRNPYEAWFYWKAPKSITVVIKFFSLQHLISLRQITEVDNLFENIQDSVLEELGDDLLP